MDVNLVCKSCQNPIAETFYFCPYCGKKLKSAPLSTSVGKQIGVYLLAVLVPPFGIIPGIKYLNQPDDKSKVVGLVTILLTGFTFLAGVYFGMVLWQDLQRALGSQGLEVGLGI